MAMRILPNELKEFISEEVEKDLAFLGLAALFDPPTHTYENLLTLALPQCELSLMMICTHPIRPLWGIMHAQPGCSNHTNAYEDAVGRRSISPLPDRDDA
jgi:hypothetical protein